MILLLGQQGGTGAWAAGFKELGIGRIAGIAGFLAPVDVEELREGARGGGVVEAQGEEAAVFVQGIAESEGVGFELGSVGAEGVGGHAEDEDAGIF